MFRELVVFGYRIDLYDFFTYLSALVLFCYLLCQIKSFVLICPHAMAKKAKKKRMIVGLTEMICLFGTGLFVVLQMNTIFGKWFTNGNANYYGSLFGWLLVLIVLPAMLRMSPLKTLDLFIPGLPLSLFFAKLGCFCYGCCSSFEMPGSFYVNQGTRQYEFPVQLVEAVVAVLLFVFFLCYRRRNRRNGALFPIYCILYAVSRFFTEFLRADLPNVWEWLDAYQILSIVFLVIGIILYSFVTVHGQRIQLYYDNQLNGMSNCD